MDAYVHGCKLCRKQKFRALPPCEEGSLEKLALRRDLLCWGLAILGICYVELWGQLRDV